MNLFLKNFVQDMMAMIFMRYIVLRITLYFVKIFLLVGNLLRADRLSSFFGDEMVLGSYLARLFPLFIFLFYL